MSRRPPPLDLSPIAVKRKRYAIVMTAMTVTFTIVGVLYGASLKTEKQVHERREEELKEDVSDRIARLRSKRNLLMQSRTDLQIKIQEVESRHARRNP